MSNPEIEENEEDMEFVEDDSEESDEEEEGEGEESEKKKVYLPGETMEENEQLVMDESAYAMYHQAQTGTTYMSMTGMSPTILNQFTCTLHFMSMCHITISLR